MKKKINLTIEPELIEFAKKISLTQKISISQLFERWLLAYRNEVVNEHWLDEFRRRNKDKLNKFSDEEQKKVLEERGKKWS